MIYEEETDIDACTILLCIYTPTKMLTCMSVSHYILPSVNVSIAIDIYEKKGPRLVMTRRSYSLIVFSIDSGKGN